VAAAALLPFLGALRCGFVWDDIPFVAGNPFLADWRNVPLLFTSGDAVGTGLRNPYYRPLTTASFALGRILWDGWAPGHHAVNLLLHSASSSLLFLLLRRLAIGPAAALAAALLFAVHPAHSEPVAYVSARADLLCALFTTASFLLHLPGKDGTNPRRRHAASVLLFALALLSKIVALLLPALFVVHAFLFLPPEKRRFRPLLPYVALSALFLVVRSAVLLVEFWGGGEPLPARLATAGPILVEYVRHALFPFGLKVFYQVPLRSGLGDPVSLASWGALAAGAAGWVVLVRRGRAAEGLGIAWFFATLLPVSGIVNLLQPAYMADRYLYIPLLGGAVALGALLDRPGLLAVPEDLPAVPAGPPFPAVPAAACAVAVVLAASTALRVSEWRDSRTFWEAAYEDAPGSFYVNTALGCAYKIDRDLPRAEAFLRRAVALGDRRALPHLNLAGVELVRGNTAAAEEHLSEALRIAPAHPDALSYLGVVRAMEGKEEEARRLWEEALRHNPYEVQAERNLRLLARRKGDLPRESPPPPRRDGGEEPLPAGQRPGPMPYFRIL
jgi:hypothetical protein